MTEHLSVRMWKGAQLPKPGIFEIDAALLDDSAFGVENAALALRRAYEAWVR